MLRKRRRVSASPQPGGREGGEHTVCNNEGKVTDTAVGCGGTPNGLEVNGKVVKQDEKPTGQA